MILPSRRYVVPTVAVLGLAAILVGWSELAPRHTDPCRDPRALRHTGAIPGTQAGGERTDKVTEERIQWSEGTVLGASGKPTPLEFDLIRDYEAERFFFRPFRVAETLEPESAQSRWIESDVGRIRVHRVVDNAARTTHGARLVASYTFLYGNRPVASPMRSRLIHTLAELRGSSPPVTMILVSGALHNQHTEDLLERSDSWLRDAVEHYVAVCGGA